jgi:hypothetical protein
MAFTHVVMKVSKSNSTCGCCDNAPTHNLFFVTDTKTPDNLSDLTFYCAVCKDCLPDFLRSTFTRP